jgi:hypothetical protein
MFYASLTGKRATKAAVALQFCCMAQTGNAQILLDFFQHPRYE